jgi:hypothetical protein
MTKWKFYLANYELEFIFDILFLKIKGFPSVNKQAQTITVGNQLLKL